MVNYTDIDNVVLDNKHISESDVRQNEIFNGQSYAWIIRCKLDVLKKWIPNVIGIPDDWELNLFDFYLIDELPFIPHIDKKGKLCLFDLEGKIIYPEFAGLFKQCVLKAKELIEDGILGENKEDFITNFEFIYTNNKCVAYRRNNVLCIINLDSKAHFIENYSGEKLFGNNKVYSTPFGTVVPPKSYIAIKIR